MNHCFENYFYLENNCVEYAQAVYSLDLNIVWNLLWTRGLLYAFLLHFQGRWLSYRIISVCWERSMSSSRTAWPRWRRSTRLQWLLRDREGTTTLSPGYSKPSPTCLTKNCTGTYTWGFFSLHNKESLENLIS